MDPIKGNKLILEDSFSNRGINFNETLNSAEVSHQHQLDLEDQQYNNNSHSNNKGKGRRNDREM